MKNVGIILCAILSLALLGTACNGKKDISYWENAPVVAERVGDVITLDPVLLQDTIVFPLSFFMEEIEIVKLDDRDEALVYPAPVLISDNYILVKSERDPAGDYYSSIPLPCKLYNKNGTYIADIGAIGQGPGEYKLIYSMQIDEKNGRIYLLPWQSDKILTYDMKGNVLEPVRLPYRANKGIFKVVDDKAVVAVLPFPGIPSVAWVQTLGGEIVHEISAPNSLKMEFDFSNEIMSAQNTDDVDLSFWFWPTRVDSLYHIDMQDGQLKPQFTVKFNKDKLRPHVYVEWPNYFIGNTSTIVSVMDDNGIRQEGEKPAYYIVDKNTLKGAFFRIENDFMGGENMDYPEYLFNNGYYSQNMDPGNLEEWIVKVLKSEKLSEPMRKKLTDIKNTIGPDDNNYVVYAKMKR